MSGENWKILKVDSIKQWNKKERKSQDFLEEVQQGRSYEKQKDIGNGNSKRLYGCRTEKLRGDLEEIRRRLIIMRKVEIMLTDTKREKAKIKKKEEEEAKTGYERNWRLHNGE